MNFAAAITKLLQLLQQLASFHGPPTPPNPEAVAQADQVHPGRQNLDWAKIIVVLSLASAIEIALLSVQVHSQLPVVFYFLELAILLAFTCFFTGKTVHSNSPLVAQVLERFGIFFGVSAFFISITIPFPAVWFKCIACFVYVVSWLAIFFFRVENGPEHVHLFPDGVIGDDTSLQLREVVPAALDSDLDGRVLGLEGSVKNLLDAAPAVLERRLYGVGGADT
ncbi:hypothetical protein ACLB2K_049466 [Fragaria x ananassa]